MIKKLPLTIIIPASDDPLINECIKSIDELVDILMWYSGTNRIRI